MKKKRNIFKRKKPQINKDKLTSVNIDVEKKKKEILNIIAKIRKISK